MRPSVGTILVLVVVAGAALAATDLQLAQKRTLVVYTTPALQDLLEKDIIPRFERETGVRVEPVYVAAGEQYNRLRMSGNTPEADVFLHASPLYIEKGYRDGYFAPLNISAAETDNATFLGDAVDGGGRIWYAFAWSPLVEVYSTRFASAPDMATADVTFGLAHPLLSNNGVYNVLYYETLDKAAGRYAISRTTVQPVNARGSVNGIADGSFDVTLGYEAVALLYEAKGAKIKSELPDLHGNRTTVPVLLSAGLVRSHQHPDAARFIDSLFTNETQSRLATSYFRAVRPGYDAPKGGVDLKGIDIVRFDWSRWSDLESKLQSYEVRS